MRESGVPLMALVGAVKARSAESLPKPAGRHSEVGDGIGGIRGRTIVDTDEVDDDTSATSFLSIVVESDVEVAVLVRVDLHVIDTVGIVGDHVALHERTGHALVRGRLAILHLEGVEIFRSKVVASLHSDIIDTARLEVDGRREEPVVVATLVVVRANDHTDATSIEVAL